MFWVGRHLLVPTCSNNTPYKQTSLTSSNKTDQIEAAVEIPSINSQPSNCTEQLSRPPLWMDFVNDHCARRLPKKIRLKHALRANRNRCKIEPNLKPQQMHAYEFDIQSCKFQSWKHDETCNRSEFRTGKIQVRTLLQEAIFRFQLLVFGGCIGNTGPKPT